MAPIWQRREVPSTGQMARFRNWRLHLKARSAAAKGLRADDSPASHEGAQRCGRLFEVKNRPRANPVRGLGGVTGIAESSCDGDVDAQPRRPRACIAPPNIDSVKICLPAKAAPVKRILTASICGMSSDDRDQTSP